MTKNISRNVEYFNETAKTYDIIHDKALKLAGGDSGYYYNKKVELISNQITYLPNTILDFGCGTGRLTKRLSKKYPNSKIIGYDPSPESIKVASSFQGCNASYTQSYKVEKYDLIVSAGVFHHIDPKEWEQNLFHLVDLLTDRGKIIIFEHNPLSLATQLLLALAGNDKDATLLFPWKVKTILKTKSVEIDLKFISFFPSSMKMLHPLEEKLWWCPFGAQYMVTLSRKKI